MKNAKCALSREKLPGEVILNEVGTCRSNINVNSKEGGFSMNTWRKILVLFFAIAIIFSFGYGVDKAAAEEPIKLGAFFDLVADCLTFGQGFETRALDRVEMYEYIIAAVVLGNKTKTLGFIEPLYCTCSHMTFIP